MSNTQVVLDFIGAWNQMNWEAVVDAFTDDVVYHNIPMEKIEGKEAAKTFVEGISPESVNWEILAIAENGNLVLTERVDNFIMAGGKPVSLPVMGTFEIRDGKICAWRDYFDLASFTSQMAG